jgi:hypothetical protein
MMSYSLSQRYKNADLHADLELGGQHGMMKGGGQLVVVNQIGRPLAI